MKICVYAICKNEAKFVDRWINSMMEADYICVLDTGSTDNTVSLLKEHNVIYGQKIYENFRFDVARNDSMKLIPPDTDVCVCVDLDEIFEMGWRKKIEQSWGENTKRARYRYVWNHNSDGSEGVVFLADKIHSYGDFFWKYPVHEILLTCLNNYETITIEDLCLHHYADDTKSRKQYLGLLEMSVNENPNDDRNMHYLGREYMFAGEYEKSILTLEKHLNMKSAVWIEERAASMRFIARCYENLNKLDMAEFYYKLAICECPTTREAYWEYSKFLYKKGKWLECAITIYSMQNIQYRSLNYISDPECWSDMQYDILSVCNYYLNNKNEAIKNCAIALSNNPEDKRLKDNLILFQSM